MSFSREQLQQAAEEAFADKISAQDAKREIEETISLLDSGQIRVCEKRGDEWLVNEWIKKAILLYFKIRPMEKIEVGPFTWVDKIPLKKWTGEEGTRIVPHALTRYGAHVSAGAIQMPSYVNIGAFVGSGTMVDTWATVGSCAQIGKNVHLSGGVGIGGVLEPVQASPVIVEDNAFIGSRCIIVEGTLIEEGAVIGAGVKITASTKILDVTQKEPVLYRGRVPKYSVVIPGSTIKEFPAGSYGVGCALIIGKRSEKTDKKVSLTETLRDFDVPV
jgi:2,3,4,5-tetrahydropyridine-2-carboxylate N-succinyltransferase